MSERLSRCTKPSFRIGDIGLGLTLPAFGAYLTLLCWRPPVSSQVGPGVYDALDRARHLQVRQALKARQAVQAEETR